MLALGSEFGLKTLESFYMRFAGILLILSCALALGQNAPNASSPSQPQVATVPFVLDHNRIVISVELALPDGSARQVRAWVDNGDPELSMSRRLATSLGLAVNCGDKECVTAPPHEVVIGGMRIPLDSVKEVKIPLKPVSAADVMADGMNAEITISSSVLRKYDVLVDFPGKKFSIGKAGSVPFRGTKTKVIVNAENGLIEVPSQIENKKYNLALDLGSSISLLSDELFDKLQSAHPDWPQMSGAIGPANMWGAADETHSKLMRVDRLQYGPLFLTNVAVVRIPKDWVAFFEKRAGSPTAGSLGTEALLNYRIGLDFAHSAVYFEVGRTFNFPDFDVIGLTLRPEDDGRFTILSIAEYAGKPSVTEVLPGDQLISVDNIPVRGSTMGQVWLMLGGEPGKDRRLGIDRNGKQFAVNATVRHFLAESDRDEKTKSKH